jgi:hypothetical protein
MAVKVLERKAKMRGKQTLTMVAFLSVGISWKALLPSDQW